MIDERAASVDLDRAIGDAERLRHVGRGRVLGVRERCSQVRALVVLGPRALRDGDRGEVVLALPGVDQEPARPQRDEVDVRGEPDGIAEVGGRPGRAVRAHPGATASVQRPVHHRVPGEPGVHRHRGLHDQVARCLPAQVQVEQPVAAWHPDRGGDGLRGHGVLEEPEAPDAVDVVGSQSRVLDRPRARFGRQVEHAAPGCLRELRMGDARDRGVAEERRSRSGHDDESATVRTRPFRVPRDSSSPPGREIPTRETRARSIPTSRPGRYRGGVIGQLFVPWRRASTFWALAFAVLDLPAAIVGFTTMITLLATSIGLLVVFPVALLIVWLLFAVAHLLCRLERTRVASLLGAQLADPVPPLAASGWFSRLWERVRTGARWREIGYLVLLLPLGVLTFGLSLVTWCGSIAMIGLPFYVDELPGASAKFWLFEITSGSTAWAACLVGLVGLALVAPWTTVLLGRLELFVARHLLGTGDRAAYEARVLELETSRVAAVDSAEAERRRIERDLHDGAQQRLVSLAMDLGAARERMDVDPDSARELVTEAHEEAKAALEELRGLVRGIHPVILEDRGLDAALSAVVARSPVPVELQIDVRHRPSSPVESTAYFVVAEALTNVARHALATRAWVALGTRRRQVDRRDPRRREGRRRRAGWHGAPRAP